MKSPTTSVVIDLQNLVTPKGRVMSPSKIYKVGFSTNGSSVLYIKEVFLSMDGVTPALGIEELNIEKTEVFITCKDSESTPSKRVSTSLMVKR